jgi:putative zinc finger protein
MTPHEANARNHCFHQEVWELIPWYANGTLEGRECDEVETHLSTCSSCQTELRRCRDIASAVHAAGETSWSPSPRHFSQMLARIDATEASGTQDGGWWERLRAQYARHFLALQSTPRLFRWALAAQGAMILLLAGVLVWQEPSSSGPLYRTLSDGGDHVSQGQAHIQVVFADDITEKELRALLTGVGGTIVNGPSSEGVYTVALPLFGNSPDLVDPILGAVRAHRKVRLAEPTFTR